MTHLSPAVFVVWSVSAALHIAFTTYHLWHYDRFRCLRWSEGPHAGSFKRLMTYTYLLSLPLVFIYATGMLVIKYKEGFIYVPGYGVVVKPYFLWSETHHRAILPLMMMLSFLWSTETTTHLEELCFWLFLMNASASQSDWFKSPYFKLWAVGSVASWLYMPFTTIYTHADPLQCEAATFLAGSLGSTIHTLFFVPIIFLFPRFIKGLQAQGVDNDTITRLVTVHELNTIRVILRLVFLLPLLLLSSDGLRAHHHINENMFGTDFLAIIAGIGCSLQSAITLIIFFPRDRNVEYQRHQRRNMGSAGADSESGMMSFRQEPTLMVLTSTSSSIPHSQKQEMILVSDDEDDDIPDDTYEMPSMFVHNSGVGNEGWRSPAATVSTIEPLTSRPLEPNRRVDLEIATPARARTRPPLQRLGGPKSWVHPLIKNFDSPLETSVDRGRRW